MWRISRRISGVAICAVLASAADWYRATAPGIEVLSDSGAVTAEDVLTRILQARAIFAEAGIAPQRTPLRVFVFKHGDEYRRYRESGGSQGFYRSGEERDYIALRYSEDVSRAVFHEFVHSVLQHATAGLPVWFEEGTAEFYSNIGARKGRVTIGESIPAHLDSLRRDRWLSAADVAAVTHRSREYSDPKRAGIFYAQSWALVHMLNLAPQYRAGLPKFVELMLGAEPDAFQKAFGRSMEQALGDLRRYVSRVNPVIVPGPEADLTTARATKMTLIDSLLARADLALNAEHVEVARELFERAAREEPDSTAVLTGLGTLALVENRTDDARRFLERAISRDAQNAAAYYELAMIDRDTGAPQERVDQLLHQAIAVNPQFGEARFLLGSHASDAGHFQVAVEHLEIAARVLARRSFVWHALGFAQWKLGRNQDAAISAYRARATAVTEAEEQAAITLAEAVRP